MTYLYPYRRGTGWRSQGYRSRPNQGANGPGGHTGFDQAMTAGQPLYAPADGIIRNSGWLSDNYKDNGWWLTRMGGDTLVIDCTDAFGRSDRLPTFIFAHCSETMAEVGQRVKKGQLVALSGNTGTATTGAHVHIEALPPQWDFNNGVYGRVDPEMYFDEWIDDYVQDGLAAMGDYLQEEDDMGILDEPIVRKGGGPLDGFPTTLRDVVAYSDANIHFTREAVKQSAAAAVQAVFSTKFKREGGPGGETDLASTIAYLDSNLDRLDDREILDPEVVAAAVTEAADKALSGVTITLSNAAAAQGPEGGQK